MDSKTNQIGNWQKLKVLGSGGFGQVTLWCNNATGEKIAVKNFHEFGLNDKSARVKQIERWSNEVDIMKKLNHKNIIATLEIPVELRNLTSMPVLGMEYCSLGDLRQVLCKAENCCGLPEDQILDILKDVSNGLAYLHSCKVVHRDLKPENIVLQPKNSVTVYKLIDLGYAKALDQSSLLKSFVGTIQYIAPELFLGKEYTSSVDYWSFGLLTHEIITGHRPFLPGFSVSDWMTKIQGKRREVISVLENVDGHITYNYKICSKNHLSRCLLDGVEKWLQLALDWDGKTRGRDLESKRIVIFEKLSAILSKKVVHVFVMNVAKTFSYEVTSETNISDLKNWLTKDTDIDVDHQILVLPNGSSAAFEGSLLNFLKNEELEKKGITFFLFRRGSLKIENKKAEIKNLTAELISLSGKVLKYRKWRRHFADLVYVLESEAVKSRTVLQGIRVKIDNTKESTLEIETLGENIREEWKEVENFSQFLSFSHKIDLENYIYYRKTKKIKSSALVQKWIQRVIEINSKVTELKSSYNIGEHKQLVLLAKQRCRSLEFHQPPATPLDDILNKAHLLWEKIQKTPKSELTTPADITNAINLLTLCAQEGEIFFSDQSLLSLTTKISEIDENLAQFKSHLKTLLKSITLVKSLIENTQKERQKEVWSLIGNSNNYDKSKDLTKNEEKGKEGKEIVNDGESKRNSILSVGEELLNGGLTADDSFLDVESVIKDNSLLRHRIHEVQQACHQMVKGITFLKLDEDEEK